MKIVTDYRVATFVSVAIGSLFYPPFWCIGIEKDGEIIGGVIFNCFEGHDVHATVAGKGWTPNFMKLAGKFAFETLRCERITAITEQDSIVILGQRLGGKLEGRLRNHFGPGRDATIIGILKDEYRFKE